MTVLFSQLLLYAIIGISFVFTKILVLSIESDSNNYNNNSNNYENLTFSFDCSNKPIGFYADMEYNCRIFHMCNEKGMRIIHACADGTSFNQEYRICDWEYNFNCSDAHKWYYLNSLTYATEENLDNTEDD